MRKDWTERIVWVEEGEREEGQQQMGLEELVGARQAGEGRTFESGSYVSTVGRQERFCIICLYLQQIFVQGLLDARAVLSSEHHTM